MVLALAAGACLGDDAPEKFYKLEFVVKEVDGAKVLNSRNYSMVVAAGNRHNAIRVGSQVKWTENFHNSIQNLATDIGVSIDAEAVKEIENRLTLFVTVDLSTVQGDSASGAAPVIRHNKWSSTVAVPFKKPTVVFASDALNTKSQMQFEITAVPLL